MEKEWEEGKVTMGQQVDALKKECADLQEKIKVKKDEAAKAEWDLCTTVNAND